MALRQAARAESSEEEGAAPQRRRRAGASQEAARTVMGPKAWEALEGGVRPERATGASGSRQRERHEAAAAVAEMWQRFLGVCVCTRGYGGFAATCRRNMSPQRVNLCGGVYPRVPLRVCIVGGYGIRRFRRDSPIRKCEQTL